MNCAASCEVIGDGCPLLSGRGGKSGSHELRPIESRNWRSECSQPTITECCCRNTIAGVPRDPTIIQLESIFTARPCRLKCTNSDTVTRACLPTGCWALCTFQTRLPILGLTSVLAPTLSPEARAWSKPDNSLQFSSQQQHAEQQSSAQLRIRPNKSISASRLVYVFFGPRDWIPIWANLP